MNPSTLLLATASGLSLLAPGLTSQNCASGPPTTLGTVTVLSSLCRRGAGKLPRTTCKVLRVDCTGIPSIEVDLRITEPDPKLTLRGTVVFGVGGGGQGFYGDRIGGLSLLQDLSSKGFRIVDRSWKSSWFGSGVSVKKQSCRYATLVTWIHKNVHTKGAFCATGNSGGSAELAYGLTTWGLGDILDVAVPSGGPPMSRLDFACLRPTPAEWAKLCPTIVPAGILECRTPGCTISATHRVCWTCSTRASAQELRDDSVLHPSAKLDYKRTRVHVVIGARDCGVATLGMLFYNAVTSEKAVEFPKGTPHWVATTQEGRDAIARAILQGAACQSSPASLATPFWPKVGGSFDLAVHGPAAAAYHVFLSLQSARLELPPFGWVFLGAPVLPLGSGLLDRVTGRATLRLQVPSNPALARLQLFDQAIAGSCLSNRVRVVIQQ
ncbi:MAG: hypothetical protein ACE5F1_17185 [Planctomycetota bacterium]